MPASAPILSKTSRFPERRGPRAFRNFARNAFTLIELLTAIAIVGVLMGILTPVVTKFRASANSARCVSNLREIGAAMSLYANDNGDRLPAPGPPDADARDSWMAQIHRYTGAPFPAAGTGRLVNSVSSIFLCPSWPFEDSTANEQRLPGYSMWAELGGSDPDWNQRRPLSEILQPSRVLLAIEHEESAFAGRSQAWLDGGAYLSNPNERGALRHGIHANYLFADGHVSSHRPEEARKDFAH